MEGGGGCRYSLVLMALYSACCCCRWNVVECGGMWWEVVGRCEIWWNMVRCGGML